MSALEDETTPEPAPELGGTAVGTRRSSPWTEWNDAESQRLWLSGKSALEIARILGCGITRNAVIGRMNRSGLKRLYHNHPNANKPALARIPRKRSDGVRMARPMQLDSEVAKTVPEFTDTARVSFLDLEEVHCRWPGEMPDGATGYCGCERVPGQSYCVEHMAKAYIPVKLSSPQLPKERPPMPRVMSEAALAKLGFATSW